MAANVQLSNTSDIPVGTPTNPLFVSSGSSGGGGAGLPTVGAYATVTANPTVTAGAYTTGMSVGGVQAIAAQPNAGILQNIAVALASGTYTGAFDLLLFNAAPSAYADHSTFTLSAADAKKLIGIVHIADITSLGGVLALAQAQNVALAYQLAAAGTTLYALLVVRGSVTFAGTTDVQFLMEIIE